jgi:hypothetical protein
MILHIESKLGYPDRILVNNSNNVIYCITALNRSMSDKRDLLVPVDIVLLYFMFVKNLLLDYRFCVPFYLSDIMAHFRSVSLFLPLDS